MLTRKDLEALAKIIADAYFADCGLKPIEDIGLALEEFCAVRNPRFNRQRFRRACFGERAERLNQKC